MSDKKVVLKSAVSGRVIIHIPNMNKKIEFPHKDTKRFITQEMFDEISYEPGFENMVKKGIIIIETEEAKEALGFNINTIDLTNDLMNRMVSVMPTQELKENLSKLSDIQLHELANYVVENNQKVTVERIDIISKISHVNIENAIRLKKQNEEPVKEG